MMNLLDNYCNFVTCCHCILRFLWKERKKLFSGTITMDSQYNSIENGSLELLVRVNYKKVSTGGNQRIWH